MIEKKHQYRNGIFNSYISFSRLICMVFAVGVGIVNTLMGYWIQSNIGETYEFGLAGLFVPDTVALRGLIDIYWELRPLLDNSWRPILGVLYLYSGEINWGPINNCFFNIALLCVSANYFLKFLSGCGVLANRQIVVYLFCLSAVAGNFYIIEIMAFPNKEMALIAITNAYAYFLIVNRSYFISLALAVFAMYFRDGYGLILILNTGVFFLIQGRSPSAVLKILLAVTIIFAVLPIANLSWIGNSVERNVNIGLNLEGNVTINDASSYAAKLFYNVFSLAFLNSFDTYGGQVHLLNFGYWQLGVFIVVSVSWAIKKLSTGDSDFESGVAVLIIMSLLGISYSTYIQPRYLMPLLFFLAYGFFRCFRFGIFIVVFSVLISVVLASGGDNTVVDDSFWLWH